MNKLDDRLRKAAIAVRKAADHAVPRPITKEATAMWTKPAMAFSGAVLAVALVIGVAALVRQPPTETPIAAVTTTTESPETTTTAQVTTITATPGLRTITGPMTGPGCPDDNLEAPGHQEGLPEPVAAMREQIIAAALVCDVSTLVELAGTDLVTDFGGGDAVRFHEAVESGEPLLETLVLTLGLPSRHQTFEDSEAPTNVSFYVWPSAFGYDAWGEIPGAERDALLELYTQEELDQMAEIGGFIGWRVGITPEGDWQFFVAGD